MVDVSGYVRQKFSALEAHASQLENFAVRTLPEELILEGFPGVVHLARRWSVCSERTTFSPGSGRPRPGGRGP